MKRQPKTSTVIAALISATLIMPTSSQAAGGRYQMTPVENGFMRLDTETGAVSICKNATGKVVCELAEDGAGQYTKDIDKLKQENKKLRAEVDRLEQHFGLGANTPPGANNRTKPNDLRPPVPPSAQFKVPQKEDVDQMFNYIEGMLNKFRERLRRLEKEPKPETPL